MFFFKQVLSELTVGESVEPHVVERRIQENRSNRHDTGRCGFCRRVSRRTDRQDDVDAENTGNTRHVHLSSLELEHGERHARSVDPRPTRHTEVDQILALPVLDADLVEDLLEVER